MQTFARKPKAGQPIRPTTSHRARFGHSPVVRSILRLHRGQGHRPIQRRPEYSAGLGLNPNTEAAAVVAQNASPIPVQARAPMAIQPKLAVSSPADRYEREADRVADQVMAMTVPGRATISADSADAVHRNCASCEGETGGREAEEEEPGLQRKAADTPGNLSSSTESAVSGVRQGGAPIPAGERGFFEQRFGRSFSDARIHTDARADAASQAIGARAFTLGRHIAFADGEYRPGTTAGRWLMAHELTHTLQQSGDTVQRLPCRDGNGEATHTVNVQPVVIAEDDGSAPTSACNFGTASSIWSRCCVDLNIQSTKTEKESDYKTLDFTPNVATAEPSALIASYAKATTIPVIFHDLLRPSGSAASKNGGTGGAFTRGGQIIFTVDGVASEVVAHEIGHALGSGHGHGTRADGTDTVMKPTSAYNSPNAHNVSQTICNNARASGFATGGADPDCCQDLS